MLCIIQIPGAWETVGTQLKISTDVLDGIKVNTSLRGNPKNMFIEVMKLWERDPQPGVPYNWGTILVILASPSVEHAALANEVAGKVMTFS